MRCKRCGRETAADDLDRLLWCDACIEAERARARRRGRILGALAAAVLALWIVLAVRPGPDFRVVWLLVVLFALGLFSRLAGELFYGAVRIANRPGARASERSTGAEETG